MKIGLNISLLKQCDISQFPLSPEENSEHASSHSEECFFWPPFHPLQEARILPCMCLRHIFVPQKWDRRNWYENTGIEWGKVILIPPSVWRFVCVGREERIVVPFVNFWSAPLVEVITQWPSIYYLWHMFLEGCVTLMPRLLTGDARASFVCHLQRKLVGVEAKKEVRWWTSSCFEIYFFMCFLVYLVKTSVVCVCGFCWGIVFQAEA